MSTGNIMSINHIPEHPESPLHVKHRETARAFVVNPSGELLLMLTHWDPGTGLPPRWLTPGGGIDAGETVAEAAVRELFEETGYAVSQKDLGELEVTLPVRIDWADGRYETGFAHFYRIQVGADFTVDNSHWTKDEHRDVIEWRWWKVADLIASGERIGPPGLAEYLLHHF
jgi:8-oxo-dGTP pyrophosphatase MutT (NUDIX family)